MDEFDRYRIAALSVDWGQVRHHGQEPCFHLNSDTRFCLRGRAWPGHGVIHEFVRMEEMLCVVHDLVKQESTAVVLRRKDGEPLFRGEGDK